MTIVQRQNSFNNIKMIFLRTEQENVQSFLFTGGR